MAGRPQKGERRRPLPDAAIGAAVLLALGAFMRVLLVSSPLGELDSDSAVTGLMARHIAQGEYPLLYWGQSYGATTESFLAAGLFKVLPASAGLIKIVPMLFSIVSAWLVWRIGLRVLGSGPGAGAEQRLAARLAAAFFWVWPFVFVWFSTRMGPYQSALTFALVALLLLLRAAQNRASRWWELAAAGLGVGAAWWANPQTMVLLAPALAFLAPRLVRHGWRLAGAVVGAVVGAAPWLWYSARNGWSTLDLPPELAGFGYGERLEAFFTTALPQAVGLRAPFTHAWLFGVVGVALYVAALAGFVVFGLRDRRLRFPVALALAYPFLYAVSTYTWYVEQPRYVLFLTPVVALLLGRAAAGRPWRAWAGVVLAGVLAVATLVTFPVDPQPTADGDRIPDSAPVHALLRDAGVTRAFADYWIAYRLTFEAEERVIVTPVKSARYPPYVTAVRAAPNPAYVFVEGSRAERRFLAALASRSVAAAVVTRGGWSVVVPVTRILPEDVPEADLA